MSANLWHDLETGPNPPDSIFAIIEIPRGHRNKYEYEKKHGYIKLDRVLYSPLHYPGEYGLIPRTYAEDGDPLDVLVMIQEPTFPGCVITCRPIGVFHMVDKLERDAKILAVPVNDPMQKDVHDLTDIPQHFLLEVSHFFEVYKALEPSKVAALGWEGADAARREIVKARERYAEKFQKPASQEADQ